MKKIFTISVASAFAIFVLTNCGGNAEKKASSNSEPGASQNEKTADKISPMGSVAYSEFKIGNQDKEFFKMPDGGSTDITINDRGEVEVKAEFEVVKKLTVKPEHGQAFVSLVALDSHGDPVMLSSTMNGE